MSTVSITFLYEPDEPDAEHPAGMSAKEYDRVTLTLTAELDADDIQIALVAA